MFSKRFRQITFSLHKWIGLHLAVLFGTLFLTGAMLVFKEELDVVAHPAALTTQVDRAQLADFGTTWDTVTTEMPDATIMAIERQPFGLLATRTTVRNGAGKRVVVWTDPVDGRFLTTSPEDGFMRFVVQLHERLLVPHIIAYLAVTSLSIVLLAMLLSGMVTYRRFWKGLLRWPSRNSDSRGYWGGMHRVLAVWSLPFLLIISLTASFYFVVAAGVEGKRPAPPQAAARTEARPAGLSSAMINAAADAAVAAYPDFDPNYFVVPRKPDQGLRFNGQNGSARMLGPTWVTVDPTGLEVLGISEPSQGNVIARLTPLIDNFHRGHWGGNATRVLWVLFALSAAMLAFGGARVFLARTGGANPDGGGVHRFVAGLGLFKWAYLLGAAGVLGLTIYRYAF